VAQIKDGFETIRGLQSYKDSKGNYVVASPFDELGNPDYIKYDENGDPVKLYNGDTYFDTEVGMKIAKSAQRYAADLTEKATSELIGRIVGNGILLVAAIVGLIAGILGIFGKGAVLAVIAAILGVVANIWGIIKGYFSYFLPKVGGTVPGEGTKLQAAWAIIFAIVAICTAVVAMMTRTKKSKKVKDKVEDITDDVKDKAEDVKDAVKDAVD